MMSELSDREFVQALRAAVTAYLEAVDRWEAKYAEYFRMPGEALRLSPDMQALQRDWEARARELEPMLPRARQLCLKHRLANPLPNLLRTTLGRHAPQQRFESAVGRNQRNSVSECLTLLADACCEFAPTPGEPEKEEDVRIAPPQRCSYDRRALLAAALLGLAVIGVSAGLRSIRNGANPGQSESPVQPAVPVRSPYLVDTSTRASMRFYRIEERPMTNWGDYGDILQHGMTAHLGRRGGLLSLERAGPYMPPITFPGIGDVVLTSDAQKILESSGLTGFGFQPVNKTRIVNLAWQEWDLKADEPRFYPDGGEPEDYILARPADRRVADQMGTIWELVVPVTAKIGRPREMVNSSGELYLYRDSWNGADIFRGDGFGSALVTERAKVWFEAHFGQYVTFEEFACK